MQISYTNGTSDHIFHCRLKNHQETRRKGVLRQHFTRSKTTFSVIASLILILAGLSACAQDQNSTPTFTNSNPIRIGVSISNKADFADDGKATEAGYQLWADMVNNSGGLLGRPVQLVILHDSSDPDQVAKNYDTLITQDHVDLTFGPFSSLLTKAAAPVTQKYGYALLEGSGGAPSVFQGGWTNLFDVSLPVVNNLTTFAYYILSLPFDQRPKTAAYLTSDDPFTYPQVDLAETLLEQAGVKTIYPVPELTSANPYNFAAGNDGNLKTEAADADALAKANADVVVLGTQEPDIEVDIQEFKKYHYNPKALIATAGPDGGSTFIKGVGGIKYAEGVFVPNGWYPLADNYQNSDMVHAYLAKYGGTSDQINADSAEAFSVGQVLQQAVEETQSITNAQIIQKLQSGAVFDTVQGTVQFDPPSAGDGGQNKQAIAYLFQWQNGQFLPVYPYSAAAENPQFPKAVTY
jgi:branched-chain amino acid transport system substrate-binding protein